MCFGNFRVNIMDEAVIVWVTPAAFPEEDVWHDQITEKLQQITPEGFSKYQVKHFNRHCLNGHWGSDDC